MNLISNISKIYIYLLILVITLSCTHKEQGKGSESGSTPLERAIYHFKMGEIYNSSEDSYKAMEEFLEAEQLCLDVNNDELKAKIYWYKGTIYFSRLDYTNALNMFMLAAEYFSSSSAKTDLMYTYREIAKIHTKTSNLEEAIIYFNKAKAIAMESRDAELAAKKGNIFPDTLEIHTRYNKLILDFSSSISGIYFNKLNSSGEALEQLEAEYERYNGGQVPQSDYLLLSCIYLDKGDISQARGYAAKYKSWKGASLRGNELAGFLLHLSHIERAANDFREALGYREAYDAVMDSISNAQRSNSVREMEQQFWQKQLEVENESIKLRSRFMIALYTAILLAVLGVGIAVILWFKRSVAAKNEQIEEFIAAVDDLGAKVTDVEQSKDNLIGQLDTHIEREKVLKELLESRFTEVRELVRTYYEFGNSKRLQKKVEDLLKLQLSGDNFETIESVVNAKNNNVMRKVREQFPQMKEENIKLLNLIYAGFSAQEISVILNDTPQNIYVRKSRLKKSIMPLIADDAEMNFS